MDRAGIPDDQTGEALAVVDEERSAFPEAIGADVSALEIIARGWVEWSLDSLRVHVSGTDNLASPDGSSCRVLARFACHGSNVFRRRGSVAAASTAAAVWTAGRVNGLSDHGGRITAEAHGEYFGITSSPSAHR